MRAALCLVVALMMGASPLLEARSLRRGPARQRLPGNSLRRRLHVNSLITKPGTVEVEADYQVSDDGEWFAPAIAKFTPEVWGSRTEFSVTSDLGHVANGATVQSLTSLHAGNRFNLVAGPLATFVGNGASGIRLGALTVGRFDAGPYSVGGTAVWSGATRASDGNPAGTFDWGTGGGRRWGNRWTVSGNFNQEKSTGVHRIDAVVEGVEFQITPSASVNVSGQHRWFGFGVRDNQLQLALTVNLGRLHR